jgi:phage shock protein C
MGVFDIGFIAVVGAFAYAFYEQHTKTKVKLANTTQNSDEVRAQLEQLKQRVATLEAIVTDKSYTLKDEISRL